MTNLEFLKHFTLARLKAVAAFLGFVLTTATLLDWGTPLPVWTTALAALITAVSVYVVPNFGYLEPDEPQPRRALEEGPAPDEANGL